MAKIIVTTSIPVGKSEIEEGGVASHEKTSLDGAVSCLFIIFAQKGKSTAFGHQEQKDLIFHTSNPLHFSFIS
jgi:hypothetical protein